MKNKNLRKVRWIAEIRLMQNTFPVFQPFRKGGLLGESIGFTGALQGASGRVYQVEIKVPGSSYPAQEPKIYIRPGVGSNMYRDNSLCVSRRWNPQRDTFAQQVLYAADYVSQQG